MSIEKDKQAKDTFNINYDEHYQALCLFSTSYVKDMEVAKDIVQEAFMQLWNNLKNVEDIKEKQLGYLFQTVRNKSINYIRSKKTRDKINGQIKSTTEIWDNNDIHKLIKAEVHTMVHNAMEQLPKQCRRIFKMTYFLGLKEREIAEKLNISINSVKSHKQRGKELLRERLQNIISLLLLLS